MTAKAAMTSCLLTSQHRALICLAEMLPARARRWIVHRDVSTSSAASDTVIISSALGMSPSWCICTTLGKAPARKDHNPGLLAYRSPLWVLPYVGQSPTVVLMTTRTPEFTLADRLRKARETAELSQDELARALTIGRNSIGRYEAGTYPPSRAVIIAWAMVTGVDLRWLLADDSLVSDPAQEPGGTPAPRREIGRIRGAAA